MSDFQSEFLRFISVPVPVSRNASGKYRCDTCEDKRCFATLDELDQHIDWCHTDHECFNCQDKFKTFKEVDRHVKKCVLLAKKTKSPAKNSPDKVFECLICPTNPTFKSAAGLKSHVTRTHTKTAQDLLHCQYCKKSYNHDKELQNHIRDNHSTLQEEEETPNGGEIDVIHECHNCQKTFETFYELMTHLQKDHNEYTCPLCDHDNPSAKTYEKHLKIKHKVKNPDQLTHCSICEKVFADQEELETHTSVNHPNIEDLDEEDLPDIPLNKKPKPLFDLNDVTDDEDPEFKIGEVIHDLKPRRRSNRKNIRKKFAEEYDEEEVEDEEITFTNSKESLKMLGIRDIFEEEEEEVVDGKENKSANVEHRRRGRKRKINQA